MNYFCSLFFCFFCLLVANAQISVDISLIKKTIPEREQLQVKHVKLAQNNGNEAERLFSGLFLFYKSFISSQDMPGTCNFHPSCSEYGILCVKKRGLPSGVMATFDRLSRCNGFGNKYYHKDQTTGKYIDFP